MSAIALGKRYERLMMSSAPLAIASAFLFFTSVASKDERANLGRCYELAAYTIAEHRSDLQDEWNRALPHKRDVPPLDLNVYQMALSYFWIEPSIYKDCQMLTKEIDASGDSPPADLERKWTTEAEKRKSEPLEMYGISVESQTEITILGTKVRVKLASLTSLLQVALGPLLVLWLGSLYNTRFRESIYNSKAASLVDIYPHLINIYPAFDSPSLRKRRKIALIFPPRTAIAVIYTITRVALVAVVLSPTVALYLWSLRWLRMESLNLVHIVLGSLVIAGTFFVLAVECMPWHWSKTFPQPRPD